MHYWALYCGFFLEQLLFYVKLLNNDFGLLLDTKVLSFAHYIEVFRGL